MAIIAKDFNKISNLDDVRNFVNTYSRQEILIFFSTYCGASLGRHNKGNNTPATTDGIPDIRRIYAAGLKVLSGEACNVREETKYYADIILKNIDKMNFTIYSKVEAVLAYICYNS